MRAVLFEGTPEEFARVEAAFRAGGDPALLSRSIVLRQGRPKTWPELDEEQRHRLAGRVLERAPASPLESAAPPAPRPPAAPGGILGELGKLLTPLADSAKSGAPATRTAATENPSPAPAAERERDPFSLLEWAELDT